MHINICSWYRVDYIKENREFFNQDILTMEDRYQGNVTIKILDDYCRRITSFIKYLKYNKIIEIINDYYNINYVHFFKLNTLNTLKYTKYY